MAGWDGTGSTRAWRKVRARILVRDSFVCRMVPGCTTRASTVDHVVPRALGGTDDPSNLRAACAAHNSSAGAALGSRSGRLGAPSRRWAL